jgi:hypothetical protein
MSVATVRRLPGFAFEARAPVYEDVLPRMDVAVFVGFAASGPVGVPVPLEDAAQFEAVFGVDATLAWDPLAGRARQAQLAPAVRAFFANGGRRCWVIRVASHAASARLAVPGTAVSTGGDRRDVEPLVLAARSPGSWADTVQLSASLTTDRLGVVRWPSGSNVFELAPASAAAVRAGDLVRVSWPHAGVELYAGIASVSVAAADPAEPSSRRRRPVQARLGETRWFDTGRQPAERHGTTVVAGAVVDARLIDVASPADAARRVGVTLAVSPADAPKPGDVVVVDFDRDQLLLAVERVEIDDRAFSPAVDDVHLSGKGLWTRSSPYTWAESSPPDLPAMTIERLGFDLWARMGSDEAQRIGDLGLAPGHPRHVALLPDDETVFGTTDWPDAATWRDAISPRFPASGANQPRTASGRPDRPLPLVVPFGVSTLPVAFLPAMVSNDPALERDGLVPFSASIFSDETLAGSLSSTLIADADYLRFFAPAPRPLGGLHAALPIEEATLIAIPDASQPGWTKDDAWHHDITRFDLKAPCDDDGRFEPCDRLACPPALTAAYAAALPGIVLTWSAPEHKGPFVVERARNADWADAAIVFEGSAPTTALAQPAAGDYFYRVRGVGDRPTEWSNGIASRVPAGGGWRVRSPREYEDSALVAVHRLLLRVCAARRDIMAVLSLPQHYREDAAGAYVRLLGAPSAPPIAVGGRDVVPIGYGELDALDFGALYHGWAFTRDASGVLRTVAPDGPVCGVIARRAYERGAWIAPANEPLRGVVALERPVGAAHVPDLQQLQINAVRQFPHGFAVMSADTLAQDDDLRPIGVRRLLILLRRVATRLGATYVFEPNDDAFRRMVQRGFEAMLGDLFQRGAFAGRTAGDAFQVVADGAINTAASIDQGRFIVELRVAPSRPLTFLTLRLVQTGDRVAVSGA